MNEFDRLHDLLDELGARKESGSYPLGVGGRIRLLHSDLTIRANVLRGERDEARAELEALRERALRERNPA